MKKKSGENGRRADILGPPPFPAARPGMGKRDGGTEVREMFLGRVPVSPRSRRLSRWASGEEGGGGRAGEREMPAETRATSEIERTVQRRSLAFWHDCFLQGEILTSPPPPPPNFVSPNEGE
jgi:hypothetical protein